MISEMMFPMDLSRLVELLEMPPAPMKSKKKYNNSPCEAVLIKRKLFSTCEFIVNKLPERLPEMPSAPKKQRPEKLDTASKSRRSLVKEFAEFPCSAQSPVVCSGGIAFLDKIPQEVPQAPKKQRPEKLIAASESRRCLMTEFGGTNDSDWVEPLPSPEPWD